jgi:hypothetical protein
MFSYRSVKCQPTSNEICPLFAARCHSKSKFVETAEKKIKIIYRSKLQQASVAAYFRTNGFSPLTRP